MDAYVLNFKNLIDSSSFLLPTSTSGNEVRNESTDNTTNNDNVAIIDTSVRAIVFAALNENASNGSSNNSSSISFAEPSLPDANNTLVIVGFSALVLLILMTIFANSVVILSIVFVKRLRNPYNILILSLAVTDLAIGSIVMPLAAIPELYGGWPLSNLLCDIFIFLDMSFCTAAILNVAAISLDRFLIITRPFKYGLKRKKLKFLSLLIISPWILAMAVAAPAISIWKKDSMAMDEADSANCSYPEDFGFQLYATLVAFFLPSGLIIYVTIRVYKIASDMAKADRNANRLQVSGVSENKAIFMSLLSSDPGSDEPLRKNNEHFASSVDHVDVIGQTGTRVVNSQSSPEIILESDGSPKLASIAQRFSRSLSRTFAPLAFQQLKKDNQNNEMKAIKTLSIFLGNFLLCWLPFFTMQLINAIRRCGSPMECTPESVFTSLLWLGYAKSLCNPIISALYNRDIHRPFKEILKCRCRTLSSTLRNEAFEDMYGRPVGRKPLPPRNRSFTISVPEQSERKNRFTKHFPEKNNGHHRQASSIRNSYSRGQRTSLSSLQQLQEISSTNNNDSTPQCKVIIDVEVSERV